MATGLKHLGVIAKEWVQTHDRYLSLGAKVLIRILDLQARYVLSATRSNGETQPVLAGPGGSVEDRVQMAEENFMRLLDRAARLSSSKTITAGNIRRALSQLCPIFPFC